MDDFVNGLGLGFVDRVFAKDLDISDKYLRVCSDEDTYEVEDQRHVFFMLLLWSQRIMMQYIDLDNKEYVAQVQRTASVIKNRTGSDWETILKHFDEKNKSLMERTNHSKSD